MIDAFIAIHLRGEPEVFRLRGAAAQDIQEDRPSKFTFHKLLFGVYDNLPHTVLSPFYFPACSTWLHVMLQAPVKGREVDVLMFRRPPPGAKP